MTSNAESPSSSASRSERESSASRGARLQRAREALARLQQDFGRTPALEEVRRALGRADHPGVSLEGESAAAFFNDDVFAPLSALEAAIRSELDRVAMEKKLYGSRPGDVPEEYRELVEKYYETLSKSAR